VLLVPPVGIAAAWLLQGETPGVAELAGGAVMLLGVAAATWPVSRPASRSPVPAR
jgi:O-acetylserine/cysteine efflux transporter